MFKEDKKGKESQNDKKKETKQKTQVNLHNLKALYE